MRERQAYYKMQNSYGKTRVNRKYRAAILENEHLKAVFLPELGGRLWSLYSKKYNKDLIYENDSLRLANLALCNAWFAGGVEFNVGMKGHSPFTCRPLFTKRARGILSNDILCMYEYEEIRSTAWSVEATLREDELLIKVTIKNVSESDTYTYWWSNIAAKEKDTRVFVPADSTYVTSYRDGGYRITREQVSEEMSYPRHTKPSRDYFYDIPADSTKWISAIEGDGVGLLHTSDNNLQGRKTFLWGTGRGGEHWNSKLAGAGNYIEIQAGLAKTQFEHLLLGKGEMISFTESYSAIEVDPRDSYENTKKAIAKIADKRKERDEAFIKVSSEPPIIYGSPRGYFAEKLYGKSLLDGLEFPNDSVTEEFRYYEKLLNGENATGNGSTAFVKDPLFKDLILKKKDLDAFDLYALSMIAFANKEFIEAEKLLNDALKIKKELYIICAAALFALYVSEDKSAAIGYAREAIAIAPRDVTVAVLYGEVATATRNYSEFIEYFNSASDVILREGRARLYQGKSLIELDRPEEAEEYINKKLSIPDLREGEYSASTLWCELYGRIISKKRGIPRSELTTERILEEYPLPYELDYRMH